MKLRAEMRDTKHSQDLISYEVVQRKPIRIKECVEGSGERIWAVSGSHLLISLPRWTLRRRLS
jgi:hypothetical protein